MTQPTNAKGRPFSWSFSRWNDFENCPAKYAAASFYCTMPYVQSKEAEWGDRVHKAAEMFLKGIPHKDIEALKPVEAYCTKMLRSGCRIEPEKEIVLNKDLKPVKEGPKTWFSKNAWLRVKIDVALEKSNTVVSLFDWKGLAIDTLLPTPSGWTTMGEVKEGDLLFSSSGGVCEVIGKSEIFNKKCYKIEFMDGSSVICDEDHKWVARKTMTSPYVDSVYDTKTMYALRVSSKINFSIPLAKPVIGIKTPKCTIHPYVLGCWIGDGKHTSGEICKPNSDMFAAIKECGFKIGEDISSRDGGAEARTVYGLRTLLRLEGLLGNKHLPDRYLFLPYTDRLALLQGLMDTDGHWNKTRDQCVFTTVKEELASQVARLISSLGMRPYVAANEKTGFGKVVLAYDIYFKARKCNPFRASRHKLSVESFVPKKDRGDRRYIKNITEIESVPTQCIAVDSSDNTFLCTDRYIVTHNTGRIIKYDTEQLELNALVLGVLRPQVEVFEGRYIWTQHKQITPTGQPMIVKQEDRSLLWEKWLERVYRMEQAWRLERFPERPSGLCGWCNVGNCKSRKRPFIGG